MPIKLLAGAFLFLPAVLFAFGVRPADVENHAAASFPALGFRWSVFDQLNNFVTDNLPLRDLAIRSNASVSLSLFGQPPGVGQNGNSVEAVVAPGAATPGTAPGPGVSVPHQRMQQSFLKLPPPTPEPQQVGNGIVTVGLNGWLYFTQDFYDECDQLQPPANVVAGLARLDHILARSGRRFIFTLAPDKATIEPRYLPSSYPYKSCDLTNQKVTFRLLAQRHLPGYVDMKSLILRRQAIEHRPYYSRDDTHWNGLSRAMFVERVVRIIDPKLLVELKSTVSIIRYIGDLTVLLGDPHVDRTFGDVLSRPGVTVTVHKANFVPRFPNVAQIETRATSTALPLITGRTLLVGDSFSESVDPQLRPFCSDLLNVDDLDFAVAPETMFHLIVSSSTVILVWNERYFTDPNFEVMWSPAFLNKLQAGLHHLQPARAASRAT